MAFAEVHNKQPCMQSEEGSDVLFSADAGQLRRSLNGWPDALCNVLVGPLCGSGGATSLNNTRTCRWTAAAKFLSMEFLDSMKQLLGAQYLVRGRLIVHAIQAC